MATKKKTTTKNRGGWKLGDRCLAGHDVKSATPGHKGMICSLSQNGAIAMVHWEGQPKQSNVEVKHLLRPSQKGLVDPKGTKGKRARPRQTEIPNTIVRIKAIDDAADDYVEARDTRMAATEEEVKAKQKLLGLMKHHQLPVYRLDDERIVEIVHEEETVKVRRAPVDKPVKPTDAQAAAE